VILLSDVVAEATRAARPAARARQRIVWRTAVYWGLTLGGIASLCIAFLILPGNGHDAFAYWRIPHGQTLYSDTGSVTGLGDFRYSPTFALAVQPFGLLPWDVFRLAGTALSLVALTFTARKWALAAICLPPVMLDLFMGNIHLLLAAAIVLAIRWPAVWSFLLLTKVTPGIGLLYLVGAHRWRQLAIALATTALLVGMTMFISGPAVWWDWAVKLLDWQGGPLGQSTIPLTARLALAAILAFWGGRTGRPWTIAVAATLSLPVLWTHGYALLVAVLPLTRREAAPGYERR
jgi:hypothetical protein